MRGLEHPGGLRGFFFLFEYYLPRGEMPHVHGISALGVE